jgi:hypothetical protein
MVKKLRTLTSDLMIQNLFMLDMRARYLLCSRQMPCSDTESRPGTTDDMYVKHSA